MDYNFRVVAPLPHSYFESTMASNTQKSGDFHSFMYLPTHTSHQPMTQSPPIAARITRNMHGLQLPSRCSPAPLLLREHHGLKHAKKWGFSLIYVPANPYISPTNDSITAHS